MELIGKLKNEVDQATSKEEARELIEKAGMKLTDEELDKVKLKDDDLEKVSGGLAPTVEHLCLDRGELKKSLSIPFSTMILRNLHSVVASGTLSSRKFK